MAGRLCKTASLVLFVALTGCFGARVRRRDPVARQLRSLDARFEARSDPAALDDALEGYLALNGRYPDDPRVLGRLARAYVVQGMAAPDNAVGSWQAAREWALQCMMLGSGFSGRVLAAGGRVTPAATELVPEAHEACALWGAAAWARQSQARGAGGVALDLPVVLALARRAQSLAPREPIAGAPEDTLGLALGLPPAAYEPPLEEARIWLELAGRAAPERLLYRVDLAELVLLRTDEVGSARALLAGVVDAPEPVGGWLPEDRWARDRAQALLDGLVAR